MDPASPASVFVPLFILFPPVLIVLCVLYYRYRRTQERYKLLAQLADKRVELPQQLLVEPHVEYSERRRALVLISAGVGIMAMFAALPFRYDSGTSVKGFWPLGLLPLMTGLGYLASWWLNTRESPRA